MVGERGSGHEGVGGQAAGEVVPVVSGGAHGLMDGCIKTSRMCALSPVTRSPRAFFPFSLENAVFKDSYSCKYRRNEGTPSPRAFIFSVENAVCKEFCRRQGRRNRRLRSLSTLTSVRVLTDSILYRENKRAWAPVRLTASAGLAVPTRRADHV